MTSTPTIIRDAQIVDVKNERITRGDVLLADGVIQSVGSVGAATGASGFNARGRFLLPGLTDGHVHIESAMLHPAGFARAALLHGTTGVFADPHEIANVLGVRGIEWMLRATEELPFDAFFTASSCVPATDMETSGAEVSADDIAWLLQHPRIVGLAEVMNFPGIINGDAELLRKITFAQNAGKIVDGHAPGLRGDGLRRYVAAGIESDHEATTREEAEEKLALGIWLMIREGSAAKNLEALLPAVTDATVAKCLFVSDDQTPADLTGLGHMDRVLRRAVALGLGPTRAVRLATWNTAQRFRVPNTGAIQAGYRANLALVEDLEMFQVTDVWHSGAQVVRDGECIVEMPAHEDAAVLDTVKLPPLDAASLRVGARAGDSWVIGLTQQQLLTEALQLPLAQCNGEAVSDTGRDILKLAVIERHGKTRNIGVGWVHGLGLKRGALAQSVAHDNHNVIVAGVNDEDMLAAARAIGAMQGGCVVVDAGRSIAQLPLRIAGLMSTQPTANVVRAYEALHDAARELGARPEHPFAALSFLALPVIPELKLTDKGLVRYNAARQRFEFVGDLDKV